MQKLLLLTFIIYLTSCSNPEDRAKGNTNSGSFNADNGRVLNSRPGPTDPKNQKGVEKTDTSANPASMKQNNNNGTNGTNRSYGKGRDTSKQ